MQRPSDTPFQCLECGVVSLSRNMADGFCDHCHKWTGSRAVETASSLEGSARAWAERALELEAEVAELRVYREVVVTLMCPSCGATAADLSVSERVRELFAAERALRQLASRSLETVRSQPFYPDTHTGMRQQWVKDEIARKLQALAAELNVGPEA